MTLMLHDGLADWIEKHINTLTATWIDEVRKDPRIQSDGNLSEAGLRDHIPAIIEEISELLRSDEHPTLINTREARVHAYLRLHQGYRAREIVRELSLLRTTLLDHLIASLAEQSLNIDIDTYSKAARVINLYIDEELSYAISVCSEAGEQGK